MKQILIIGYGNTLRGDDGAGQRVAQMVAEWGIDGVRSLFVHQLTPELAEPISTAELAIFVDAYPDADSQGLQVRCLEGHPPAAPRTEGRGRGGSFSHSCNPRSLLQMANFLYRSAPPAWWLLVPAVNFDFGEDFSAITQQGVGEALSKIKELIG